MMISSSIIFRFHFKQRVAKWVGDSVVSVIFSVTKKMRVIATMKKGYCSTLIIKEVCVCNDLLTSSHNMKRKINTPDSDAGKPKRNPS